jgi:hypothetical protein
MGFMALLEKLKIQYKKPIFVDLFQKVKNNVTSASPITMLLFQLLVTNHQSYLLLVPQSGTNDENTPLIIFDNVCGTFHP